MNLGAIIAFSGILVFGPGLDWSPDYFPPSLHDREHAEASLAELEAL